MTESGGPGAHLPARPHPSSLLTPASPSPCFSNSCSILVVPGAAGSNWPPPQGAEAVWSKSAGRLLMGDLESGEKIGLRLTSRPHSCVPPPPLGVPVVPSWTPPSPGARLSVPSSPKVPPAPLPAPPPSRCPLPHMEDRLSWGEVPRHRKLQSSRSGSWKEKGSRDQRGRGAVGLTVPAWEVGAGSGTSSQTPFPQELPQPQTGSSSLEGAGSPGLETWPLGRHSHGRGLVSFHFSSQKGGRCLASFRTTSQSLSWTIQGYRDSGSRQFSVECGSDTCYVTWAGN